MLFPHESIGSVGGIPVSVFSALGTVERVGHKFIYVRMANRSPLLKVAAADSTVLGNAS